MYTVYRIFNKVNGRSYIGLTLNLKGRINTHFYDLSTGKHHSWTLQDDYNKFGADGFGYEVLDNDVDAKLVANREKYFIKFFGSYHNGYNQNQGGYVSNQSEPKRPRHVLSAKLSEKSDLDIISWFENIEEGNISEELRLLIRKSIEKAVPTNNALTHYELKRRIEIFKMEMIRMAKDEIDKQIKAHTETQDDW